MTAYAEYQPREGAATLPSWRGCVRPAQPDDAGAIALLVAEREGLDPIDTLEQITRELRAIAAGGSGRLFLAEHESTVVGFGRVRREDAAFGCPAGWYLLGVVVAPAFRRIGIGLALTRSRVDWVRERGEAVYYFANAKNLPSIELHAKLGFVEVTRDFEREQLGLKRGDGVLFRRDLAG